MIDQLFAKSSQTPLILQSEVGECGLACVAMVSSYYGHKIDLVTLRREVGVSGRGASVKDLQNVASTLKLSMRPLRIELGDLLDVQKPAILHWNMSHFVVLVAAARRHIVIHDPAAGRRKYSLAEASKHFTGIAVELTPTSDFQAKNEVAVTRLRDLFKQTRSFYRAIGQILFLSVIVQLLTIAGPFYAQLIIDQAVARHDFDLLRIIAIGFLFIAIFRTVSMSLRSYALMYLTNQVGFHMASNVFSHLISLPGEYFERRHTGDVASRFGAIGAIRKTLTEDVISAVLDGCLAVLTLLVLFLYSVKLTLVLLIFVTIFSLFRIFTIVAYRNKQEEVIVAEAKQQSMLMENMRAIQAIKAYCKELARMSLWKNSFAEVINSGVKLQRFQISVEAVQVLLFAIENIIVLYLAARLVMASEMTVGMLLSFAFMKGHFEMSVGSFIRRFADIKLVRLQLERVSDITGTPREVASLGMSKFRRELLGGLELRHLAYSYSSFERPVFTNVCFTAAPGSLSIIAGASGAGKSTLMRQMAGLLRPSSGEILADGVAVSQIGYRAYRSQIACVLQSTQLMSGTLVDNISMYDERPDMARVERAAQTALVHAEIAAMPMGYNSLIGDMGSIISAGQAQRVLIARAVYHQPKIILLDEAMSNLDFKLERTILENLRELGITIVMVTHRKNVYDLADNLYSMNSGSLQKISSREAIAAETA